MSAIDENVVMNCAKCPHHINSACKQYVVCNGPCEEAFHMTCISLSKNDMQCLSTNIRWFRDACLPLLSNWKQEMQNETSNAAAVAHDVSLLKKQVADIFDLIGSSSSKLPYSSSAVIGHSTPIVSSNSSRGTNVGSLCSSLDNRCLQSARSVDLDNQENSDDRNYSLLLTNIDKDVKESEIRMMVCRCLDAPIDDCRNVVKLVSNRTQSNLLDYISFRVDLHEKWKPKALAASTWPCGIKYREFVKRQCSPWKPIAV